MSDRLDITMTAMRIRAIKFQALILGDEELATKADLALAQCANLIQTLDASGTRKLFHPGSTIQLRATGADGEISGIASASSRDEYGHKIAPGAFNNSIRKKGLTGSSGIKLLLDHDWTKPAGVITRLAYNSAGSLEIDAKLALDISYVRDRWAAMKSIGGYNFSVGFVVEDYEIVETKDDVTVLIKQGDLFETSLVAFPGNIDATLNLSAATGVTTLRACGSAEDKLTNMLEMIRAANRSLK